jgi:transglutaminase-like putative cysteine protease
MAVALVACPIEVYGQDPNELPAAIYEVDDRTVDWSPVKGLIVTSHRVIRVNRTAGNDAGRIRIWDTFFQKLKSFQGEVRDTTGRVLFRAGLPDVRAVAPFSEFRLYSGDIVRAVDLVAAQPPFVIETRWVVEIENAFFWPDWTFEDSWPRRRASYEVQSPPDQDVRWREAAGALTRSTRHEARRDIVRWDIIDWTPRDTDIAVVGPHPLVHIAPEEFKVGRLKGRTDSWDALGRWYWSLTRDQIQLRSEQEREIERHIKDKVGDRARAAALKDWISDQWRYVAIEVGLGGWRPNRARDVFANRYGDCKDVVFLWIAMMRSIGLDAYPALVRARNPLPIKADFPKDWFDHVIGMTVINGDTLWADLSDSRYPLGTLPRTCESRWALVVGGFGGRLLWTPDRSADQNVMATRLDGVLQSNGDLSFTAGVYASGHFARQLPLQGRLNPEVSAAVILGASTTALDAWLDSISVVSGEAIYAHLHGTIRGWALAGQKQIVVRPRVGGWVANDTLGRRPEPSLVDFAQSVYDTLSVQMPEGWEPDFWPAGSSHEESVGRFDETRHFAAGRLTVLRQLRANTPGREPDDRRAASRLRTAHRLACGAEWVFKRSESRPEDDSH